MKKIDKSNVCPKCKRVKFDFCVTIPERNDNTIIAKCKACGYKVRHGDWYGQSIFDNKNSIPHHLPMDDGDLTKVNEYLLSEGFTKEDLKKSVIGLTKRQHKIVHELEAKRFKAR